MNVPRYSAASMTLASIAFAAFVTAAAHSESNTPVQPGSIPFDVGNPQVQQEAQKLAQQPATAPLPAHKVVEDRSGRKQAGKASVYSGNFQGRLMANGKHFDHGGQSAASRSLPLGTVAKVTNLKTGQTATVKVEDRGPYVDGRTVDLTRSTAKQIGLGTREGVTPVIIAPIAVPQPDGSVKPGAGAMPGPATELGSN